jgi:hypothetical protein
MPITFYGGMGNPGEPELNLDIEILIDQQDANIGAVSTVGTDVSLTESN